MIAYAYKLIPSTWEIWVVPVSHYSNRQSFYDGEHRGVCNVEVPRFAVLSSRKDEEPYAGGKITTTQPHQ